MARRTREGASERKAIDEGRRTILLAEYAALHELAAFRLAALDRRVPLGVGTLGAFLAAAASLPPACREVLLAAVPLATIWLVRTTLVHARSFADAIRRIAAIEEDLSASSSGRLMQFQSFHPSRQSDVGGRTGSETVWTALSSSYVLLAGSAWIAPTLTTWSHVTLVGYLAYLICLGAWLATAARRFRAYRPT